MSWHEGPLCTARKVNISATMPGLSHKDPLRRSFGRKLVVYVPLMWSLAEGMRLSVRLRPATGAAAGLSREPPQAAPLMRSVYTHRPFLFVLAMIHGIFDSTGKEWWTGLPLVKKRYL